MLEDVGKAGFANCWGDGIHREPRFEEIPGELEDIGALRKDIGYLEE